MTEASFEDKYNSLRRLYDSQSEAVVNIQTKQIELLGEITLRDQKLINCQSALDINKTIMQNALTEQNRIQTEYGAEIQELKAKIKELEQQLKNQGE
jgi:hypothetical protein